MSIEVILDVFSGRENPRWVLSDDKAEDFFGNLEDVKTPTLSKPISSIGLLGYRGFIIRRPVESPQGDLKLLVHNGIVDFGQGEKNRISDNRQLERWLLDSAPDLDDRVKSVVYEELEKPVSDADELFEAYKENYAAAVCPTCQAADAPIYNPGMWNIPTVQPYNNCYNYANNKITNTFAQPGRAHGQGTSTMACSNVQAAAQADGLVSHPNFSDPLASGKGWYVALVIWPGVDYHWYRQDKNGCWSHKPGSTPVINTDNSGNTITDPRTCDRGNYTDFCMYMITNSGVVIS